jgi:Nuclease-related domain
MSPESGKTITLRYPGRCAVCGRELRRGDRGVWYQASGAVKCLGCATVPRAAVDPGAPGASAMAEYERRRIARERRARGALGSFGAFLARITGDPTSTKVWKQGAEGEVRLARRLNKLLKRSGVWLLHDRRIPGHGQANIDHLAIGPGGITVIDAKTHHGKVRVQKLGLFSRRRQVLRINGRNQTRLVDGVQRQAEHGVAIGGPRHVAKLTRRDGALGAADVEQLWRELAIRFPAATG